MSPPTSHGKQGRFEWLTKRISKQNQDLKTKDATIGRLKQELDEEIRRKRQAHHLHVTPHPRMSEVNALRSECADLQADKSDLSMRLKQEEVTHAETAEELRLARERMESAEAALRQYIDRFGEHPDISRHFFWD